MGVEVASPAVDEGDGSGARARHVQGRRRDRRSWSAPWTPEGYLASAGLQAGDVITGADGAAFDGSRPASQVLTGLISARKDLKIQVVRAGKTLEATVDSEKFAVATNHLRSLEPGTR